MKSSPSRWLILASAKMDQTLKQSVSNNDPTFTPVSGSRLPQLDGIRGLAILSVVVWHYAYQAILVRPGTLFSHMRHTLSLTWSGVDLFFVLSGFLIAGILLDNRRADGYFRVFYVRRACRILPLYILLLVSFIVFRSISGLEGSAYNWLFAKPFPLWSFATFTQNFFMGIRGDYGPNWLGITWSLAVEEQFYLFIPLFIYLFPRSINLYIFLFFALLAPLLRIISPGFHETVIPLWRADSIFAGVCLAILVRSPRAWEAINKYRNFILQIFLILLAGTVVMTLWTGIMGEFSYFWLAALYSTLILIAIIEPHGFLGRLLSSSVLVWLGTHAYGIYMFHEAISGLVFGFLRGKAPVILSPADAGVTVLAVFITLILASLSYKFVEKPILQYGYRFRYKTRPDFRTSQSNA